MDCLAIQLCFREKKKKKQNNSAPARSVVRVSQICPWQLCLGISSEKKKKKNKKTAEGFSYTDLTVLFGQLLIHCLPAISVSSQ